MDNVDIEYRMLNQLVIPIKIINKSKNPLPSYATKGSSCFDLYSNEDKTIRGFQKVSISTGIYVQIPPGYEIQIRPRSGLAFKHQITVLNSPGTIDSDYIGEIKICIINHDYRPYDITIGDRIAQGALVPVYKVVWEEVINSLEDTERGTDGFGSTGK